MPKDCCIYPPEADRYVLAARFAHKMCAGAVTEKELDFMNNFLSLPTAFDEWFPSFDDYSEAYFA